jgi:PIN domain nuclease of toxin-antitoxin system
MFRGGEDPLRRALLQDRALVEIRVLPIYLSHAPHIHVLPGHHRNPFDCLLISQAMLERLMLLSADPQISRYPVEVVW